MREKLKQSSVFEETYTAYLEQLSKIQLNSSLGEKLGIAIQNNTARIPLFNNWYEVSENGIVSPRGEKPTLEISVVLFKYLLLCPEIDPIEKDWISYKDFPDTGPLVTFFANDVEVPIAGCFSDRLNELKGSCGSLGGVPPDVNLPYDLVMQFSSLPKVPILMLFNDRDDEFQAKCSVLFEKSAESYLDAECLAIIGALFSYLLRHT